jgi:hypothetical protein
MTIEMTVIPVRNELASGLMACAQGLDVKRLELTTSMQDLQALLAESVVLKPVARIYQHSDLPVPWIAVHWQDDAELAWSVIAEITPELQIQFDEGRWSKTTNARYVVLTDAELRLTIEKEINRNGTS